MTYAETLTEKERRYGRLMAYSSAWFACISEVMLDSSAIIIIYLSLLQGSDAVSMFTTSISGICSLLLFIPCAALAPHIGLCKSVKIACFTGCIGYLLMATAPFFGTALAKYIVLLGCLLYALQRPLYSVTWYPMLDNFLRPEDRGSFFGTLRYSYMLLSGGLFFIVGLLIGKNPPVWLLQTVIGITGLLILPRYYFMSRFPQNPNAKPEIMNPRQAFGLALTNSPLVGYSVYASLYSMAYTPIFPLVLIYLKSYVKLAPGTVQLISTLGIAGSITGFFLYSKLLKHTSLKIMELSIHCIMLCMVFILFFYSKTTPGFIYVICAIVFIIMFCQSCFLCNNSAEMMALAPPGNKIMATSYCQTYTSFGSAAGRTISSFLIGTALLSDFWKTSSGHLFCKFQTLFLGFGCLFILLLFLTPLLPSFVSKHSGYYEP